ncbi:MULTISPECIES: hypothetical protein [Streptomyces]|uniref:Uncharacterized protein n=1 Tax=Streptomyces chumphonensis TaxID=1214925 RepID=A0A927F0P3_9ACTN|nr:MULTISPECIES: hypothetical protein [Streptomyces]MBD3932532.1 hypothetical protein [Streptomyces chumphonensis]MCZ7415306.1 hypothetical protein [Streptomyces sp. WMMC897]
MAVTISLALLFGGALAMLLKSRSLGAGSAFVAAGFGYFLASTGAAGPINEFFAAVIDAIPNV